MKVAIHSKTFDKEKVVFFKTIFNELQEQGASVRLSKVLKHFLIEEAQLHEVEELPTFDQKTGLENVDYVFSVGGDGTLLDTVTYVGEKQIPIFGINTGRLGFLATTPSSRIKEGIDAICKGFYSIESRTLIELVSDQDLFKGLNFGLNEFTILKRDTSSMIVVHTYLNGEYLNSYWADGLIIATPTGSSGYSLSVGGPIVMPGSRNFIISPVCPHNLNVRPLIVSDESIISFEIEGRSKNFLVSLDSRSIKVDSSVQLAVKKCRFPANLLKLKGDNYLNTLRLKLNWGMDARN
ncbi:MAG: NAD kinase [Flammeovirgaceae bacterium]|nr:NAD kinase [Flammeovirgaceae bacterium]MDW8286513.1 NAD kinase [Flammeovirgaceae bacterium]